MIGGLKFDLAADNLADKSVEELLQMYKEVKQQAIGVKKARREGKVPTKAPAKTNDREDM